MLPGMLEPVLKGLDMAQAEIRPQAAVDLTSCDREPIHHIGAIQPVGFLVALSPDWTIVRLSANAARHLGGDTETLLGASLIKVVNAEACHVIRNRLASLHGADAVERAFAVALRDDTARFDLALHRSGETIVIEAEPSQSAGTLNAGHMVRAMLARLQGQASLVREATRLIQALTGFDRVMIYRFHPDDTGEVIAERVIAGLEPYFGLRYPAEDIPRQARELLVRNPVRLLADVNAEPSPIVSQPGLADVPLDLSMSTLRAHSAMCIEYLRNMGVGATMTISLTRHGKLWGLISCHHMSPRHVGFEQRTTAELFGQILSLLIEQRERDDTDDYEARTRTLHDRLIAGVVERGSSVTDVAELADRMAELVPCDGIGVYVDGHATLKGLTPTAAEFMALCAFLDRTMASEVSAITALGEVYAPAHGFLDRAAGILVVPLSWSPREYVIFFRQELARSVIWAGIPGKVPVFGPHGVRLTPRKSFEAWREVVRGHSMPWTKPEQRAAEALRVTLLEVVLHLSDQNERQNRAAAHKQELLVAELNHRVRNILGLIRGLVAQSRTSAADVATFAEVLGDRVYALARAHDQITAKNWDPSPLAKLIATEAGAYLGSGAVRVAARGPAVSLQPSAFSTVALVLHELMTNAAKYGALSDNAGQVAIHWSIEADGDVALEWRESGGPPVQAPSRLGFGSTIIQRSIPHELGGKAVIDYATGGLRAHFVVPRSYVVIDDDDASQASSPATATQPARLSGLVLLVEDNVIIALDAEDMLMSLGAERVTVASNVADALRAIALETPSFALLDINLGHETSWPVAARLRKLGVRHVFATGYGRGLDFPLEHRLTPSITKPYSAETISMAAGEAMNASAA